MKKPLTLPHEMTLTASHEGTEEFTCPVCGRTLLIELDPFRRVVVDQGNNFAAHRIGMGGLSITGAEVEQK